MNKLKTAIVGAGTAGLAAASLLQRNGHQVTLFEQFAVPKPLGAGLLIQPTGLAVLSLLGLDQYIIESGSIIHRLYGKESGSSWTTLDVKYSDLSSHLFGVGTHRGNLFTALYNKALESKVDIQPSHSITSIKLDNGKAILTNSNHINSDKFDLVIDASGQHSPLRKQYADVKYEKQYPFGALWSIVKFDQDHFQTNTLEQRYRKSREMAGVLPVGKLNRENEMSAAFFWSIPIADYQQWRSQAFDIWQKQVISLWPETENIVSQFTNHDDLIFATYSDIALNQYHHENIVFIGDAAHCTSPQLGQGANLALVDAYILSICIANAKSINEALSQYTKLRKNHITFYQAASRMLTPFFQSNSTILPILRFFFSMLSRNIPFTRRMTAQILTGTKSGLFSSLNNSLLLMRE